MLQSDPIQTPIQSSKIQLLLKLFVKDRTAFCEQIANNIYIFNRLFFYQLSLKRSSGIHTNNLEAILVYAMYFKVVATLWRDERGGKLGE